MSRLQRWWVAFGLTIAAVAVSYWLLDRPISQFSHVHFGPGTPFIYLTYIPEPFPYIAGALLVVVGVLSLSEGPAAHWQRVSVAWSFASLAATMINRELKFVFGRTWPETWSQGNPSLIHDDVFGFHFFQTPHGHWYTSFPSGHAVAICAAATVLWICYPRLRAVSVLFVVAVVVGLLGSNFHFLSDIVAGGFFGTTVALVALRLAGLLPAKPCIQTMRRAQAETLTPPGRS